MGAYRKGATKMPRGEHPNSKANLEQKRFDNIPAAERREKGSKGAAVTNAKLKEQKTMREQMQMLMGMKVPESSDTTKKIHKQLKDMGIPVTDITYKMSLVTGVYNAAVKGNQQAVETVRELIGEQPIAEAAAERVQIVDDLPED